MPLYYRNKDDSESCENEYSFSSGVYEPQDSQSSKSQSIAVVVQRNVSCYDVKTLLRELDRCGIDKSPIRKRIEEDLVNEWLSLIPLERSFETKEADSDYMVEPCNDSLILSRRRLQRRKPNSKSNLNKLHVL
jgi:hypothetical protein